MEVLGNRIHSLSPSFIGHCSGSGNIKMNESGQTQFCLFGKTSEQSSQRRCVQQRLGVTVQRETGLMRGPGLHMGALVASQVPEI